MEDSYKQALHSWQNIKLTELQKDMDKMAQEVVDNQRESQVSRKNLAEQTREFKKLKEEDRPNSFKSLLKNYQAEIDNLTKRSKFAESAFMTTYKQFADAPDPAKILETVFSEKGKAEQLEVLVNENKRLRSELDDSSKEFIELKTKASAATRLKEKLNDLETKMDQIIQDKIKDKEISMREEFNSKLKVYKEREYELERQLTRMKDQLEGLQSTQHSSQASIFAHTLKFDETVSAKLAELDIVMNDLERANERLLISEREKELLKKQLEQLKNSHEAENDFQKLKMKYEDQLSKANQEILKMTEEMNHQKNQLHSKQLVNSSFITGLEEKVVELQEELEQMKEKLMERRDYDDIKKELEVLKEIEFSVEQNQSNSGNSITLEQLLISKNKRLQTEFTALKVQYEEIVTQLASAIEREESTKTIIEEQRSLISKMEEDMSILNLSDQTVIPISNDGSSNSKSNDSILPIIANQRDRYKKRNKELEELLQQAQDKIRECNEKIESLNNDNLKLYETVRFLQSYRDDQKTGNGVHQSKNIEVANKYKNAYEDKINPFVAFAEKERAQRFSNLSVPEKITVNLGRALIANKYGRIFVFFYSLALHSFALLIIFKMSAVEECKHDHALQIANSL